MNQTILSRAMGKEGSLGSKFGSSTAQGEEKLSI